VLSTVAWFALIDSRIERREFGHGDLFLTRDEVEDALTDVLKDEPELEPFLRVEALPLRSVTITKVTRHQKTGFRGPDAP